MINRDIKILFCLCWISYFFTYLGRLNYSAGLTEIIQAEGFTKGQAGMIGTGLFQAFIWSPMIRLVYEYYKTETRMRAC